MFPVFYCRIAGVYGSYCTGCSTCMSCGCVTHLYTSAIFISKLNHTWHFATGAKSSLIQPVHVFPVTRKVPVYLIKSTYYMPPFV